MTTTTRRKPVSRAAAELNAHFEAKRSEALSRLHDLALDITDGMSMADADAVGIDELLRVGEVTREWFGELISDIKTRKQLAVKARRRPALEEQTKSLWKQIVALQDERDQEVERVRASFKPTLDPLVSKHMRAEGELNQASQAERQMQKTMPEWLQTELARTTAEFHRLQQRSRERLRPIMGVEAAESGQGLVPAGNTIEARDRFAAFQLRKAEHAAEMEKLLPEIEQLKERRRLLEEIALDPWPLPERLAEVDAAIEQMRRDQSGMVAEHRPGYDVLHDLEQTGEATGVKAVQVGETLDPGETGVISEGQVVEPEQTD